MRKSGTPGWDGEQLARWGDNTRWDRKYVQRGHSPSSGGRTDMCREQDPFPVRRRVGDRRWHISRTERLIRECDGERTRCAGES